MLLNSHDSRWARGAHPTSLALTLAALAVSTSPSYAQPTDIIARPLTDAVGDVERGKRIVADRRVGLCLLCHQGPDELKMLDSMKDQPQGNISTNLTGAGSRWTAAQLRMRIVDSKRVNPDSVMPSYFKTDGLTRVGEPWKGQTIFTAQQVEDVVAYLVSLK
jgi:L-cysteine S-thiosulfotransferase